MSVDVKTLDTIRKARSLSVRRYKRFDKIFLRSEAGKLDIQLKVRGFIDNYPDLKQVVDETMEKLYGEEVESLPDISIP